MHVTIDPSLDADADLRALVAARAPVLERVFDGTADAEWRMGADRLTRRAAFLALRDPTGARAGANVFSTELYDADRLEARVRELKTALEMVRDWRVVVDRLFATIRPWCETLPGVTAVAVEPIRVAEGESGEYDINQMVLTAGRWPVRIYPLGAWVVGWEGAVRIAGLGDHVIYYSRAQDAWYHIPNHIPYREIPLTEELFRQLVESVYRV